MTIEYHNSNDDHHYNNMLQVTAIDCTGDIGKTLQAPADELDLNVIMKRFGVTDGSQLPKWQNPQAIYGDFTGIPDNPTELAETLRQGELAFKILPAAIRNRFQTGTELYTWLKDPTNGEEAVKLGLLHKSAVVPTLAQQVTQGVTDAMVSINTSSDKEPLVKPQPTGAKK